MFLNFLLAIWNSVLHDFLHFHFPKLSSASQLDLLHYSWSIFLYVVSSYIGTGFLKTPIHQVVSIKIQCNTLVKIYLLPGVKILPSLSFSNILIFTGYSIEALTSVKNLWCLIKSCIVSLPTLLYFTPCFSRFQTVQHSACWEEINLQKGLLLLSVAAVPNTWWW